MTRVKICGIMSITDARVAVAAGADAIGLVFADSPRKVTVAAAREIAGAIPPLVNVVGVFLDQPVGQVAEIAEAVGLDAIQLHGDEPPSDCRVLGPKVIKRFNIVEGDTTDTLRRRMSEYDVAAYLLDPGAGSGRTFDWSIAGGLDLPLIVSGGLNPGNVGAAIRVLRPLAVDVSSGVERGPGVKDAEKVREFIESVRKADAAIAAE